jgi:hypothetical protein
VTSTPRGSKTSIGRMNWLKMDLGSERNRAKPGSAEYFYYTDRSGVAKTTLTA